MELGAGTDLGFYKPLVSLYTAKVFVILLEKNFAISKINKFLGEVGLILTTNHKNLW